MEKLLQDWILPKTLSSGCWGEGATLENFVIDKQVDTKGDQFASEVVFVRLTIKLPKEGVKSLDVVVKVQLQNEEFRNLVNSRMQFENEIFTYETVLPALDQNDITKEMFCKYYYGYVDPSDPSKDFIVLEDLRTQGYRLSKEKVFLDFDHCAASLKQLGRFHALSYIKKHKNVTQLLSIVNEIQDKWTPENLKSCQYMIESCARRGIQPLIDGGESVELLESLLREYKDVATLFTKLVTPVEPEAVICHGDFNRNNLLFQYDENDCVTGVKLIDLQTPRYSSPVIDISFLMCMNMTHTLRTENLNDLLDIYKQSVSSTVENSISVPQINFSPSAIYGYILSSFFLPIMLEEKLGVEEVLKDDSFGRNSASTRGGQKETDLLSDIVRDLISFGFIKKQYD